MRNSRTVGGTVTNIKKSTDYLSEALQARKRCTIDKIISGFRYDLSHTAFPQATQGPLLCEIASKMPRRRARAQIRDAENISRDFGAIEISSSAARSGTSTQRGDIPSRIRDASEIGSTSRLESHPLSSTSGSSSRGSLSSADGAPPGRSSQRLKSEGRQVSRSPKACMPVTEAHLSRDVEIKKGMASVSAAGSSISKGSRSDSRQRTTSSLSPRNSSRPSIATRASGSANQDTVQRRELEYLRNLPNRGMLDLKKGPYLSRTGCAESVVTSETIPIHSSQRKTKTMPVNDPHGIVEKSCLVMRIRADPIATHLTAVDLPDLLIPAYNDKLPNNLPKAAPLWIRLADGSFAPEDLTCWKIHDAETHDELDFLSPDLRRNSPDPSSWKKSLRRIWHICTKNARFDVEYFRTDVRVWLKPGNLIEHARRIRRLLQALIKFEWYFEREEANASDLVTGFLNVDPMPWNLTRLNNWKQNSNLNNLTRTEALKKLEDHDLSDAEKINGFYAEYLADPQDSCNIYRWQINEDLNFLGIRPWTVLNLDSDFITWIDFIFNFLTAAIDCPLAQLMTFPDNLEGLRHFMTGKPPLPGTSLISPNIYDSGDRRRYRPSRVFEEPGPVVADPQIYDPDRELESVSWSPRG